MNNRSSIVPSLCIALLCIASIGTGAVLLASSNNNSTTNANTAAVYILGPARKLLSSRLYERADIYFHKGAPRHREEAFNSFFQKWKKEISPTLHAHAHGNETAEILPWLRLASQSDPQNIEIFLVASFWLSGECGHPDLALQAIDEALEKNPDRYELYQEKGRVFLMDDTYNKALEAMEQALNSITQPNQEDPEQAALDRPFIYGTLSLLYETSENQKMAIKTIEQSLSLNYSLASANRLEMLKSGKLNPNAAKARLHQLFHKEHKCERDEHEHEHTDNCTECSHH